MPGRPKPQKRPGGTARLLSEVVADNVRAYRTLRRTSQDALAARMVALGHPQWTRAAVSEVERHGRQLVIDELLALALILGKSVPDLLDPASPVAEGTTGGVDLGAVELDRWAASAIVRDVGRPEVEWPDDEGGTLRISVEVKPGHDQRRTPWFAPCTSAECPQTAPEGPLAGFRLGPARAGPEKARNRLEPNRRSAPANLGTS